MSYTLGQNSFPPLYKKLCLYRIYSGAVLKSPLLFTLPSLGTQGVLILPSGDSSPDFLGLALAPFITYCLTPLSLLFSFLPFFLSHSSLLTPTSLHLLSTSPLQDEKKEQNRKLRLNGRKHSYFLSITFFSGSLDLFPIFSSLFHFFLPSHTHPIFSSI